VPTTEKKQAINKAEDQKSKGPQKKQKASEVLGIKKKE
jgi:hypothetical protein